MWLWLDERSLSGRIGVLEKLFKYLVESGAEIECRKRNRHPMMEIECPIKSLERKLPDLEWNEKGFDRQMKKNQAAAEDEGELNLKRRESFNDVKMGEEVSDEHAEWVDVGRVEVQNQSIHRKKRKKLEEIESREQNLEIARECLGERERKVDTVIKTLDERISAVEAREKEFSCFQERKMREIELNEEKLEMKREELAEQEKLVDENLRKREELKKMDFKRLEFLEKKLEMREVECRENVVFESVALCLKEGELLKESMEKQLEEFGKVMGEFNLFQEEKMRELKYKEQLLNEMSENLSKDAKLRNGEMIAGERSLNNLLKRLKLAKDNVESLKGEVDKRFKMVLSKEIEVERDLQAWEKDLEVKQLEVDSAEELNQMRSEKLNARENSMRALMRSSYNEHRARERSTDNSNSHVWMKPDESVDLKFTVRMDGKNLQMFLNDPEKDLESMGDEIFKVLHLSSDPAKLVLDAMVGFYPPQLRIVDTTAGVRATCIALLKQLMNMSRKIKPCVREEALKLALEWKFNMSSSGENPTSLEVVGFLLLLATYDVASSFDKEEISSFLMMVAAQKEASKLSNLLGLAEA